MQLLKFNKNTFALIDSVSLSMTESEAMTISDYLDSYRNDSCDLPFSIKTSSKQIPFLNEEDFAISVRERVDLTATGPYERTIADENKDIGQHNYKNKSPYRPRALTEGFIELKDEKQ